MVLAVAVATADTARTCWWIFPSYGKLASCRVAMPLWGFVWLSAADVIKSCEHVSASSTRARFLLKSIFAGSRLAGGRPGSLPVVRCCEHVWRWDRGKLPSSAELLWLSSHAADGDLSLL